MQGRLVTSTTGELEASPGAQWREEFRAAADLRLNHIELVADRFRDFGNPIWSAEGRDEIVSMAETIGVGVPSLCVNEVLASPIDEISTELVDRLEPVVSGLPVDVVVVPLLEASDLKSVDSTLAAGSLHKFADCLGDDVRVVVELGVSAVESLRFLDAVGSARVGLCYDVGNATALGFDAADELRILGSAVWHLHAKDKNAAQENVCFGTGEVPFVRVFEALSDHGFDGLVTMEATRGDDPFTTADDHRAFLLSTQDESVRPRGERRHDE